ncbi:MAG: hypothetical protein J3K34DRAFT_489797 [Monoraphidium minutum]|nr:MAG: hypothetical protein J3K34DRAFT_489797 [Monoraphidium minutum]
MARSTVLIVLCLACTRALAAGTPRRLLAEKSAKLGGMSSAGAMSVDPSGGMSHAQSYSMATPWGTATMSGAMSMPGMGGMAAGRMPAASSAMAMGSGGRGSAMSGATAGPGGASAMSGASSYGRSRGAASSMAASRGGAAMSGASSMVDGDDYGYGGGGDGFRLVGAAGSLNPLRNGGY